MSPRKEQIHFVMADCKETLNPKAPTSLFAQGIPAVGLHKWGRVGKGDSVKKRVGKQ